MKRASHLSRAGMTSRSTFDRQPRRPPKQIDYTPRPRSVVRALVVSGDSAVVAIPKGPKAKPGKTAPTVDERTWMESITALGCIVCLIDGHPGTPGAVHHILSGGRRMGHMHTICLCDPGHHQNGHAAGKISRHPFKARFEAEYGSESDLLDLTQQLVASCVIQGTYRSKARELERSFK